MAKDTNGKQSEGFFNGGLLNFILGEQRKKQATENLFDYREFFYGDRPGFDLGDLVGDRSIWKGKKSSKLKDPNFFEESTYTDDEHPLDEFLSTLKGDKYKSTRGALKQLYNELTYDTKYDGDQTSAPTIKMFDPKKRDEWETTYTKFEVPEYIERIRQRYFDRGEFEEGQRAYEKHAAAAKRSYDNTISKDRKTKLIGGVEVARASYGEYRPRNIIDPKTGERTPESKRSFKKWKQGTGRPELRINPGEDGISDLVAELAHYVQYKGLTGKEKVYQNQLAGEQIHKHGSPHDSLKIYGVEDSYEWDAHTMIQPSIDHRFEELLQMYEQKPLKIRK
tara:strand:+ start:2271 stop:3278 length:1008 start_codon:yes stop_codon:yes gene_type:complete